jgi:hypothetical protein
MGKRLAVFRAIDNGSKTKEHTTESGVISFIRPFSPFILPHGFIASLTWRYLPLFYLQNYLRRKAQGEFLFVLFTISPSVRFSLRNGSFV